VHRHKYNHQNNIFTLLFCYEPMRLANAAYQQGWSQGSFVEAEAEVEAERSKQRRDRLNSRQGRGEATPEKTLLP